MRARADSCSSRPLRSPAPAFQPPPRHPLPYPSPPRRETHCDFCRQHLPDWKDVLTPNSDTTSAPAVMNVNFDNKTYSFTVRQRVWSAGGGAAALCSLLPCDATAGTGLPSLAIWRSSTSSLVPPRCPAVPRRQCPAVPLDCPQGSSSSQPVPRQCTQPCTHASIAVAPQVAPGSDGYRQFTLAIRKAFHLPEDSELNITFTCDEPSSGEGARLGTVPLASRCGRCLPGLRAACCEPLLPGLAGPRGLACTQAVAPCVYAGSAHSSRPLRQAPLITSPYTPPPYTPPPNNQAPC